jgi:hypothetical protein
MVIPLLCNHSVTASWLFQIYLIACDSAGTPRAEPRAGQKDLAFQKKVRQSFDTCILKSLPVIGLTTNLTSGPGKLAFSG